MSKLDVLLVKENYDLYTRIQNDKRKLLLSFIYLQSRKYKEPIEFSGLKPGSLYHHLSILEPLIEKRGHSSYYITEFGIKIVEDLNLITGSSVKPKIKSESDFVVLTDQFNDYKHTSAYNSKMKDNLSLIWVGNINYLILVIILTMSVIMAFEGVELAGSAIYATGPSIAFKFDLAALILGTLAIYTMETRRQSHSIYNRIKFDRSSFNSIAPVVNE